MLRSWCSTDLIQPGTAVRTSACAHKHRGWDVSHPLADQISWTLDERQFGEGARGDGSGETVWVSLRSCYNIHIIYTYPARPPCTRPAAHICASRNSALIDTFSWNTCERTYFCRAVSARGRLSWTVAGSVVGRQHSGKNEFGLFGATQKEKKKGRLAIYTRIIFNHGPLNGHCFSIWWVYSRYKPPVAQK